GVVSGSRHSRFRLFLDDPLADLPDAPTENRIPPVHDAHCPLLSLGASVPNVRSSAGGLVAYLPPPLPFPLPPPFPLPEGGPASYGPGADFGGFAGLDGFAAACACTFVRPGAAAECAPADVAGCD